MNTLRTNPRMEVDLSKIRKNTQTVVRRLESRGIDVTGVTKAVCGHPSIASAMLKGGAKGLAESRIGNVQKLRMGGMTCPVTLIRTPMLSQADQVVQFCESSYNTEIVVIAALAAAAIRNQKVHGIILMVEMGDLREGILAENLGAIARQVMEMPGVALKGIGTNLACLSGEAPNAAQMAALCTLANEVESACGVAIQTVSGGNSANLPWALAGPSTGRINDLRLGEAILLGVEPVTGHQIGGMYTDAFTLISEVIETGARPAPVFFDISDRALARPQDTSGSTDTTRLILALGHQDTDISGLSIPIGSSFIGATSDHLVLDTNRPTPRPGSEMRFQVNYNALMHAMAAPDVAIKLLNEEPEIWSQPTKRNAVKLALV